MKALSLRQPWAWAVVHGGKSIENRVWSTKFRGEFLIHAAKGMRKDDYEVARDWIRNAWADLATPAWLDGELEVPQAEDLLRGGIVGAATLVDVIGPCYSWLEARQTHPCPYRWHMAEQHGFLLKDVRAVPFVPYKGALGFFEVPLAWSFRGSAPALEGSWRNRIGG